MFWLKFCFLILLHLTLFFIKVKIILCFKPWSSSLLNELTRIFRRLPMLEFSGAGSGTNSSFVALHRAILQLFFENLTFAALVASTFFVNAVANSTYARIRPIASILRPVYHHPNSSTLTILFLSTNLFPSVFYWTPPVSDYTKYVLFGPARATVWFPPSNRAVRKRIARSLRIDFLRTSFGFLLGADFTNSKNLENDPHSSVRKDSFNISHVL